MPGADEPDLATLRKEYGETGLTESAADPDPFRMFRRWFADAEAAPLHEPNAMVVATVSPDGRPAARMVLLKGLTDGGFAFYTNTTSRKGDDLAHDPRCALLFPWHPLERQVRVEGVASRLSDAEVAAYFAVRPRGSQLGAHASPQSQVVASREELDRRYAAVQQEYGGPEGGPVPVPPDWGGYRVRPDTFEFWQGRPGRMHDRLRYTRSGSGWSIDRLAP